MDKWTKLYTALYVVFTIGIFTYLYQSNLSENSGYVAGLVLLAVFLVSYLMVPKISFNHQTITVKNTFNTINIAIDDIKIIETYPLIGFNIRTMGVGGVFGFFGYFNWGEVWYVTNIYKKVKIMTNSKKTYMISVENPVEFVEEIKKLMQS